VGKGGKAIRVTGRGGLYGCRMLRIPHCLDSRLIDGGKVVSPPHLTRHLSGSPQWWRGFYLAP
jgi:hypothetical protein